MRWLCWAALHCMLAVRWYICCGAASYRVSLYLPWHCLIIMEISFQLVHWNMTHHCVIYTDMQHRYVSMPIKASSTRKEDMLNMLLPPFHNISHSSISHIQLDSLTSIWMWEIQEWLTLWNGGSIHQSNLQSYVNVRTCGRSYVKRAFTVFARYLEVLRGGVIRAVD